VTSEYPNLYMTATYSPEDNKIRISASSRLPKELYERVRAAGFIWAPKQEIFVAPMWTPGREDLAIELCGEIGDEDTSLVDRAEQRAERFEEYSDSRRDDAERAREAVSAIADNIPLGQPILVGHHSERHARRDAEKIENGMRRAVKMWETSEYWKRRAAGAIHHAKYKELPSVRARRIKGLESDIRVYRSRFTPDPKQPAMMQEPWDKSDGIKVPHVWCSPRGGRGGSWVPVSSLSGLEKHYSRLIRHCELRLEYERAMLGEQGAMDLLKPKPRSAKAQLPLCNYPAPGGLQIENVYNRGTMIYYPQVEMTQAEYARINVDYKATRTVDNSHRVRTAMIKHELVCVFLTDAKVHDRPGEKPKPERTPEEWERRIEEAAALRPVKSPDPLAEEFDALKATLKAGVKVVSAPQLFPTPKELAQRMVEEAGLPVADPSLRILEPSAGTGAILDQVFTHAGEIVAVEINYSLADALRNKFQAVRVQCSDFLECNGDLGKFDRILMNPPFANGDDIKHIQHAVKFLKPNGRLVAICAGGPRQNAILKTLAEDSGGIWEPLEPGTFKESGTMVNAVLLTIEG
jgi:protein-L-isoaspartate O-methyltransferase